MSLGWGVHLKSVSLVQGMWWSWPGRTADEPGVAKGFKGQQPWQKAQWDGQRRFTFYSKAKLKITEKKKNLTTLLPFGTLPFYCSGMDRATPDVSRSRKSAHRQPVSIIPSWNLSCHNVLFLRYFLKKKNCDSGWCKNGASCRVLKLYVSLCGHGERFSTN